MRSIHGNVGNLNTGWWGRVAYLPPTRYGYKSCVYEFPTWQRKWGRGRRASVCTLHADSVQAYCRPVQPRTEASDKKKSDRPHGNSNFLGMHGFLLTKIGELRTDPLISRITSRAEFKVRSTGTSSNSNHAWNT